MTNGEKRALLIFTLVGIAARLFLLIEYSNHNPFYEHPILDSVVYLDWSEAILQHRVFFEQAYHHPPGYAFFLAAIFAGSGINYFPVLFVQGLMVALDGILVFLVARKLFDRAAAWTAMVLFSLSGPFLFYSMKILSETLYSTLLLLSIFCILSYLDSGKLRSALLAGLFLGGASEVRGNGLICVLPVLAGIFLARPKRERFPATGAFLAGLLIVMLPVLARNVMVADAWTPVASNWGENLYFANNEQATGTFSPTAGMGTNLNEQIRAVQEEASRRAGRPLDPAEAQKFWMHEAFQFLANHPISWLALEFQKIRRLFSFRESSSMYFYDLESSLFSFWLRFLFIGFGITLILFFGGLMALRKSPGAALVLGFCGAQVLLLLVFWPELRFMIPIFPLFFIVGGNCIHLRTLRRENGGYFYFGAIGLLACIVLNLMPLSGTGGRAAWYANASAALIANSRPAQAVEMARKAIALNPRYSAAWVNLGAGLYKSGDVAEARKAWENALKWNHDDYEALANLAISYRNQAPELPLWKDCLRAATARQAPQQVLDQIRNTIRALELKDTNKLE